LGFDIGVMLALFGSSKDWLVELGGMPCLAFVLLVRFAVIVDALARVWDALKSPCLG
jgi:hypothetical protein